MRLLERIVQLIEAKSGSDIHLIEGDRPRVRLQGDLLPLESKDHPHVTREDIEEILERGLTAEQKLTFAKNLDIDFSLQFQNANGRVNVGYANGRKLHLVMRYLRSQIIPDREDWPRRRHAKKNVRPRPRCNHGGRRNQFRQNNYYRRNARLH